MKLKRFLIIFLCVALLAAFSVICFATDATTVATTLNYGFYISPGEYVFDEVLSFGDLPLTILNLNFNYLNNSTLWTGIVVDINLLYFYGDSIDNNNGYRYTNGSWTSDNARYITVLDGFYIYDINLYQWWQSNVTRLDSGYDNNLLDGFLSIFTAIGQWISGAAANLTSMFFVDNSLTFVGTLSVAALSMAVVFLIIGLISRFLRFKA